MLNLVLAAIKNKEEINQRENFLHSIGSFVARVFLVKEMGNIMHSIEGEKQASVLWVGGGWLFLTNVPELSVPCFMAQFTLSLTLISSNSAAQIWYGGTFQRDNVGVLCQQPQSFVIPPGNCHKLRCQLHLVRACRVFPVSWAPAF